ncbi:hypothetical protein BGX24_002320, partial [Mortierella sp. AD032]
KFAWAGTDFSHGAGSVGLKDGTVLHGYVKDGNGDGQYSTLDLDENIKNVNGVLTYVGPTPPPRPAPSSDDDDACEGGNDEGC